MWSLLPSLPPLPLLQLLHHCIYACYTLVRDAISWPQQMNALCPSLLSCNVPIAAFFHPDISPEETIGCITTFLESAQYHASQPHAQSRNRIAFLLLMIEIRLHLAFKAQVSEHLSQITVTFFRFLSFVYNHYLFFFVLHNLIFLVLYLPTSVYCCACMSCSVGAVCSLSDISSCCLLSI